jgi:carbamoyl-phosphate synthase large subunit
MKSTGEVMGIASDFGAAFAKSQISAFGALPKSGSIFLSLADKDKNLAIEPSKRLHELGFSIYATEGTHSFLQGIGVPSTLVKKHFQKSESSEALLAATSALDLIRNGEVSLVINTPYGKDERQDGRLIRTASIVKNLPCITTVPGFKAAVAAIGSLRLDLMSAKPIQEWLKEG